MSNEGFQLRDAFLTSGLRLVDGTIEIPCSSQEQMIYSTSTFQIFRLGHFLKVSLLQIAPKGKHIS